MGTAKVAFLQVVQPSKTGIRHDIWEGKKATEKTLAMLMINNGIKSTNAFIKQMCIRLKL